MNLSQSSSPNRSISLFDQVVYQISRHWIVVFAVLYGSYVILPFIAPILMRAGWAGPGKAIYLIYSFLCHQLPQRSYFLFGPQISYPLEQIQAVIGNTGSFSTLRRFAGNSQMGWKVAWSDRMVSMYTSILLLGMLWYPLRRRISRLPWWGLILFLLPMALDGSSHMASDIAGIGQGFRDTNQWLAILTQNAFPVKFYLGDAWYSFNGMMRILTGFWFGAGVVWFGFPYLDDIFVGSQRIVEYKIKLANMRGWSVAGIPIRSDSRNGL